MDKKYHCSIYMDLLPLRGTGELSKSTEDWMDVHEKQCKCHLGVPSVPKDVFANISIQEHSAQKYPRFIKRLRRWATSFLVITFIVGVLLGVIIKAANTPEISLKDVFEIAENSIVLEEGQLISQISHKYKILTKRFEVIVYAHNIEYTNDSEQPVLYTIEAHRVMIDGKTGDVISVGFSHYVDPLTGKKLK